MDSEIKRVSNGKAFASTSMPQPWAHSYRMRPYYRNVGIVCTCGFLAMGIVSTTVAFFNVDGSFPNPKLAAVILGVFWSAWCLLGVWLILAYYRYRLLANQNEIRQIGVIREQHVPMSQVQELKWRCFPAHGSVRLSGSFGVVKIGLGPIANSERENLLSFFRSTIDGSRQSGWAKFDEQLNQPSGVKKTPSRRARFWLAIFFIANGIAFFIAWCFGLGNVNLIASPLNIVFGTYMLIKLERDGESHLPKTGEPNGEPERLRFRRING